MTAWSSGVTRGGEGWWLGATQLRFKMVLLSDGDSPMLFTSDPAASRRLLSKRVFGGRSYRELS